MHIEGEHFYLQLDLHYLDHLEDVFILTLFVVLLHGKPQTLLHIGIRGINDF